MKKLEIEVLGSMYQDWDNEEFSWDVDNIIKVKVDNELAINKRFGEFTCVTKTKPIWIMASINQLFCQAII